MRKTRPSFLLLAGILVLVGLLSLSVSFGAAQPQEAPAAQGTPQANLSLPDAYCLSCHNNPNLAMQLENGELLALFVPPEVHEQSIHGRLGYACVQCHAQVGEYPHPPFSAADARDVTLQLYTLCERCHASYYELTQDSVHQNALEAGNRNAAVCVDCHTAHAVRSLDETGSEIQQAAVREWVPQTCAKCHYAIYQRYSTSVHGAALLRAGNIDVPTCIDCHGVHNIPDPETAAFRLLSPQICAECHTDPNLMHKYSLSTQVLETYVADFHGTTWAIFEQQHPDQAINTPVCYDCHGIHDIQRVDDPEAGIAIKENLLVRCQDCHPEANINFPDAWLSHYIPTPETHPLVFTVNVFYLIFIPSVLGGMAILVAMDAGAMLSSVMERRRRKRAAETPADGETPVAQVFPALEENPLDMEENDQDAEE